jgi:hypothetical protein
MEAQIQEADFNQPEERKSRTTVMLNITDANEYPEEID